MKLALIHPKSKLTGNLEENDREHLHYFDKYKNIDSLSVTQSCPNLGLLTIAGLATGIFDEIVLIDEDIESVEITEDFDVIGFTFMTKQAESAYKLVKSLRHTGAHLIAGGMHVTHCPEEALEYFDTVFIGEAEKTWFEFVDDFKKNQTKKIYKNLDNDFEMDNVPMPRYDLLKIDEYKTIPLQIGRGCPHNCIFCSVTSIYGNRYRHKSVDRIIKEIELIKSLKKFPYIFFTDDNLRFSKKFIQNIMSAIEGGGFQWMGFTDVSVADNDKMLSKLHDLGCRRLSVGFESVNPDSLKNIEEWKYKKALKYPEHIKKIQSKGIALWGNFILGFDEDDTSCFPKLADFIIDTKLYGSIISILTPFPGSEIFKQLDREGRILTKRWGSYSENKAVFKPAKMTVKELEDGFDYVADMIYSEEAVRSRVTHYKDIYSELIKSKTRKRQHPN